MNSNSNDFNSFDYFDNEKNPQIDAFSNKEPQSLSQLSLLS